MTSEKYNYNVLTTQKEHSISVIKDYIEYINFSKTFKNRSFDEWSYSTAIAEKLIELIKTENDPPLIVIENLKFKISQYQKNKRTNYIYSIVLTAIDDIISSLCD